MTTFALPNRTKKRSFKYSEWDPKTKRSDTRHAHGKAPGSTGTTAHLIIPGSSSSSLRRRGRDKKRK